MTTPPPSRVLEPPAADPGISEADREALSDLLAKGLLRGVNLSTPDVDEVFDRLQAIGADVVQEPTDQSYGRECAFRDPAGRRSGSSRPPTDPSSACWIGWLRAGRR